MSQPQRFRERRVEIARQDFARDSKPEEVGTHEFQVWLRNLCETAEAADLAGQTPEGINEWLNDGEKGKPRLDWRGSSSERGPFRPGLKRNRFTEGLRSDSAQ